MNCVLMPTSPIVVLTLRLNAIAGSTTLSAAILTALLVILTGLSTAGLAAPITSPTLAIVAFVTNSGPVTLMNLSGFILIILSF